MHLVKLRERELTHLFVWSIVVQVYHFVYVILPRGNPNRRRGGNTEVGDLAPGSYFVFTEVPAYSTLSTELGFDLRKVGVGVNHVSQC